MRHRSLVALALACAAPLLAACGDAATAVPDHQPSLGHNARDGAPTGTTAGWFDGQTVDFFYNKDFFCAQPPSSGAPSGCELGEEPTRAARPGDVPVVYVMTPLGFTPPTATLHCPVAGDCINHPATIDASRVFGAGAESIPLPPHSHVVDVARGGWWEIEVVGVTDPAVWSQVVAGKSLATVRTLQAAGQGITGDIPTNLFLFFGVRPGTAR